MADVSNTAVCARPGCGHPGSMHADVASGQNSGKCAGKIAGGKPCACTAFQAASSSSNDTAAVELATTIEGPSSPTEVAAGPAFRAVLIQEGVNTQDGRHIAPNALAWRDLPLPLMVLTKTGPGGHEGAEIGGRIDQIERQPGVEPGTFDIVGTGVFDTGPVGAEAARLVGEQTLRGISGDLVDVDSTVKILAEDEDGWPTEILETVTQGVFAAATVCPIPAFAGCTISLVDTDAADEVESGLQDLLDSILASGYTLPAFTVARRCLPCERSSATLLASGGPMTPPAGWFTDPDLPALTPLTVTDDGRIFGHLAAWGTCHIGYDGQCVTPPRSMTNYANYRLGVVPCADGSQVNTGTVTLGGGHASTGLTVAETRAHYDDTGTAVADVAAGEDEHGIWIAGALRPDVTQLQLRQLRACGGLSGDWRQIGGYFELVAALAVNVPGFPVSRVAAGAPVALVAAGARAVVRQAQPWRADLDELRRDMAVLKAERLMGRIRGSR